MRTCSLAEGAADAATVEDSMLLPGWDGEDRVGEAGFGERRDALVQVARGAMNLGFVSDEGVEACTDRCAVVPKLAGVCVAGCDQLRNRAERARHTPSPTLPRKREREWEWGLLYAVWAARCFAISSSHGPGNRPRFTTSGANTLSWRGHFSRGSS
jgi:hypothetical protein